MILSWTLRPGEGAASMRLKDKQCEALKPGQVRVDLKAWSLNARDVMVAMGHSPMPVAEELVPLSDAAGVVTEIGENVTRVLVGDRVVITFNPAHQSGAFEPHMGAHAFGEMSQGLLTKEQVLDETALVKLPDSVSFEQAACLPCAAVTVWNALFESGSLFPGQTVLATGTGTVSLIAMQFAKAAGARFGITSSSDAKLERAQALGADFGVNYRERPDWDQAVHEATNGAGADIVLETAGPPSIATSVKATAQNGRVVQIGFKSFEGPAVNMLDLVLRGIRIVPIMVGSRVMLQRVVAAVSANDIKIPIHATIPFNDAPMALAMQSNGDAFGKITITSE